MGSDNSSTFGIIKADRIFACLIATWIVIFCGVIFIGNKIYDYGKEHGQMKEKILDLEEEVFNGGLVKERK